MSCDRQYTAVAWSAVDRFRVRRTAVVRRGKTNIWRTNTNLEFLVRLARFARAQGAPPSPRVHRILRPRGSRHASAFETLPHPGPIKPGVEDEPGNDHRGDLVRMGGLVTLPIGKCRLQYSTLTRTEQSAHPVPGLEERPVRPWYTARLRRAFWE